MNTTPGGIPTYRNLPLIEELGLPHAWGVFGEGDRLGSLNRLSPQRVLAGLRTVRHGQVLSLDLPLGLIDPPLFDRAPLRHAVVATTRNEREDVIDAFNPQSSTQWDGLGHVRCREYGFWGGAQDAAQGRLGMDAWAEHGIVGRGVLLDVHRHRAAAGRPLDPWSDGAITRQDLLETAEAQGVRLADGDVLCVRTGWVSWYRGLTPTQREDAARAPLVFPGLSADESVATLLWDKGVAAVVTDNPAVERSPGEVADGSLHRRLIPLLGVAMGELFDLDALAEVSAAERRYYFFFVAAPLNLPGAVSSPANALAIR